MNYVLAFALVLFGATPTFAGDLKRNGGNVLLCYGHYESFDLYEGAASYGYKKDLPEGQSYQDIAEQIIARIEKYNPSRAALYLGHLKQFLREARFVEAADFTGIPDIGEGVSIAKNCSLIQTVSQYRQNDPNGKRYLVNQDVWSQLSEQDKAVLVLHEIIYREAIADDLSLQNSIGVRHFTAYLSSQKGTQGSYQDYINALIFSGIQKAEYKGLTFLLHSGNFYRDKVVQFPVVFSEDGTLATGVLGTSFTIPLMNKTISCMRDEGSQTLAPDAIKFTVDGYADTISSDCTMEIPLNDGLLKGYAHSKALVLGKEDNSPAFAVLGGLSAVSDSLYLSSSSFKLRAGTSSRGFVNFTLNGEISSLEVNFEGISPENSTGNYLYANGVQVPIKISGGRTLSDSYTFTFDGNQIHWDIKPLPY